MVPVWLTVVIALIAPAFALGGVIVGAWMQRRTTCEQIDAQRKKDEESWRREDRHRFANEKRILYAEIIAHVQAQDVGLESLAMDRSGKRSTPHRSQAEWNDQYEQALTAHYALMGQLTMISTDEVTAHVFDVFGTIEKHYHTLMDSADKPERPGSIFGDSTFSGMVEPMRRDVEFGSDSRPTAIHPSSS